MITEFWRARGAAVSDTPADGVTAAPISSNWAYDHAASTQAHGISAFGATLVDDVSALAARETLGLTDAYFLLAIQSGALM